jgi:thiol-disulfide isomerase/thioredoxin
MLHLSTRLNLQQVRPQANGLSNFTHHGKKETDSCSGQAKNDIFCFPRRNRICTALISIWLIAFFLLFGRCGHCKTLEPKWETLAETLSEHDDYKNEGIVIAKIDLTTNMDTLRRFDIEGYPTLKYFANRQMYTYKGDRNVESLMQFVTEGYKSATGEKVPPPPSWVAEKITEIRQKFAVDNKIISHLITDLEHIFKMRKNAAVAMVILSVFFGFFIGFFMGGSSRPVRQQATRAKSASPAKEKKS